MVRLTRRHGDPIWVNPERVVAVFTEEDRDDPGHLDTVLILTGGRFQKVREAPEVAVARLEGGS